MKYSLIQSILTLFPSVMSLSSTAAADAEAQIDGFFSSSGHTNNWAVLVDSSRFWFNYRHIANTLSIYRTVKRLGIPDSNIILMLADDVACNARNPVPATVYNSNRRQLELYGDNIEVDYRGYDVNVENFIRMLTGRVEDDVPRSKRLLTDDRSNVLVFMTGHGGEDFLKFQDNEELGAQDIADAFQQMWEKKRYHELLFMIDTCQAESMFSRIYSPNILAAASSKTGEPSYSHHADNEIGVAVIDRFTYYNLETLERLHQEDQESIASLFNSYNPDMMLSHPRFKTDLFRRPLDKVLVTDFFGGVQSVLLTESAYVLEMSTDPVAAKKTAAPPFPDRIERRGTRTQAYISSKMLGDLVPLNFLVGLLIYMTLVSISLY